MDKEKQIAIGAALGAAVVGAVMGFKVSQEKPKAVSEKIQINLKGKIVEVEQ
jgi:membrane associated rhomboid family serine protease